MSNRDVQPFRFACPSCGSAIELTVEQGKKPKLYGAESYPLEEHFTGENPFIDLHIDFPVSFEPYVMGQTPFLKAIGRIGQENFEIHNFRLNALNDLYKKHEVIERVVNLHKRKRNKILSELADKEFNEPAKSFKDCDINMMMYCIIAKVFYPFSTPTSNSEDVSLYLTTFNEIIATDKNKMDSFVKELIESKFLFNLQEDCFEIYPRILELELALRPALFLDYDKEYIGGDEKVPYRVSSREFKNYKDLYKDISEIISRQIVLVAGVNNLLKRKNHNKFSDDKIKSLNDFANKPFGKKIEFIDDTWLPISKSVADNQLRNAVAHYKAEYDEVSQMITYFPRQEGMKQEKPNEIYFLGFTRKILDSYRLMHSLNQLIKCLLNYDFFMRKEK
ncbi:hypothetical protein FR932_13505 [Moritella marina ATCC 15381]|uniref:Uncharacterized protein n=1 Tax=Moritella marina ATCC 15381 TaxID=1202962 RepID=A0A5J6WMW3_MORMI|nr:hypothetical protein [Moritella marina]QFI38794.1 hypothetical protein FR932_13505 [Moritella marina ATCC 15381]